MPSKRANSLTRNDKNYTAFYNKTQFMKHEVFSAQNPLVLKGLNGNIHRIFNLSDIGLHGNKIIDQSAMLATHFLVSGPLDKSFRSMVKHRGKKTFDRNFVKAGSAVVQLNKTEDLQYEYNDHMLALEVPLTEEDKDLIQIKLDELVRHLTYERDDTEESTAFTDCKYTVIANPIDADRYGHPSVIQIPGRMIDELTNTSPADIPKLTVLQFEFAVMLVHEVGHAFRNYLDGRSYCQPYFGTAPLAEIGYDIEKRMFDGVLGRMYTHKRDDDCQNVYRYEHEGTKSKLIGVLVLLDYPCKSKREQYRGLAMEVRSEDKLIKDFDTAWRIPLTFITKFFDDSFWTPNLDHDGGALVPKREEGYVFRWDKKEDTHFPLRIVPDETSYILGGFKRNKITGDIKRILAAAKDNKSARRPSEDRSVIARHERDRNEPRDYGWEYEGQYTVKTPPPSPTKKKP